MSHNVDDFQDFSQPSAVNYGAVDPYAYQPSAIPGQYQVSSQSSSQFGQAGTTYAQSPFGVVDHQQQQQQPRQSSDIVMSQAKAKIDNALRQFGSNCQTSHFQLTPEETVVVSAAVDKYYESNPLPAHVQAQVDQHQSVSSNSAVPHGHHYHHRTPGHRVGVRRYGSFYGGVSPYYWGPYGPGLTAAAIGSVGLTTAAIGAAAVNPLGLGYGYVGYAQPPPSGYYY